MTDTQAIATRPAQSGNMTLFEAPATDRVHYGVQIANVLSDVIEKQRLYSKIGPNKHVTVEGWNVMGCLLGVMPKEREVKRLDDGSYEATVDLVSVSTGHVVGGASHICSVKEARWGKADDYARRSMAVTRATGKAFRLGFSWIIKLAGYEATPFEEMPAQAPQVEIYTGAAHQKRELMDYAKTWGIQTKEELMAISEECMGIEMNKLSDTIKVIATRVGADQ